MDEGLEEGEWKKSTAPSQGSNSIFHVTALPGECLVERQTACLWLSGAFLNSVISVVKFTAQRS